MQTDLELGRLHRRRYVHEPDTNGAFSSVRLSLAICMALRNLIIEVFNMQGRDIATDQQITDDLAKVGLLLPFLASY